MNLGMRSISFPHHVRSTVVPTDGSCSTVEDSFELDYERRQIIGHDFPQDVLVSFIVSMDQSVTYSDGASPFNEFVFLARC
ncbi:MAG TPA: hypothetical protein VGB22_04515 [candidate division Zixibacteria bacterium]|jgi:hypothetical protein